MGKKYESNEGRRKRYGRDKGKGERESGTKKSLPVEFQQAHT
jgi:hypothetical protein